MIESDPIAEVSRSVLPSRLLHELALQRHRTESFDAAIDVVVPVNEFDVPRFGAGIYLGLPKSTAMIEQLKTFPDNVLAIEVIDGFSETDEKLCQKWFATKRSAGHGQVNVLVKLDEIKVSASSVKAFFEDMLWALRNYTDLGHLAIVAHSKVLKALVPVDNLFFQRASEGRMERYFDVSQMDEAFTFVQQGPS